MKHFAGILLMFFALTGIAQTTTPNAKPGLDKQKLLVDSNLIHTTNVPPANQDWVTVARPLSNQPVWIIDSVKVSAMDLNYIDPNEISNINIVKNAQYPDGAIYVTLKDHSLFTKLFQLPLLSLNDISKANIPASQIHKPVIYILDDKVLTDTALIRIPAVCITKVAVIAAVKTPYFKTALPNVLLMTISTAPLTRKPDHIMIRGAAANK
jgi:hypothetical protein